MPSTGLAGTDAHSAHDARTVLIKIPFMIKELLDWMFLCSPDTEPPPKRIRNQSFPLLATGNTKIWNTVTVSPLRGFLNPTTAGKMPTSASKREPRQEVAISAFQKLSTRAASISINASGELQPRDPKSLSLSLVERELAWLLVPQTCRCNEEQIRALWQDGRKPGSGRKAGKAGGSAA